MNNISKLGLGIIAFEGLEHIKNITYELRNLCNMIIICLQKYSYHGIEISQDKEEFLTNEIFKIFYLTHRDAKQQIKEIELNKFELPYKKLYELVFPPKNVEFHTEYFIDLLNLFSIELENF